MPEQNKPDVTNNPPGERSQASNDQQGKRTSAPANRRSG